MSQERQSTASATPDPGHAKPPRDGNLGDILGRIDQRLRDLNLSERGAARAAGLSPAHIRTMRQQYSEGRQHGASIHTITGLARALRTTPEWLIYGVGEPEGPTTGERARGGGARGLHLVGTVAAGVWNERGAESDQPRTVPVPPDPRFPPQYQSAYEVRGPSTNRVARPGDYLIVVDQKKLGLALRSGDLVILAQVKEGLREVTARRYILNLQGHCFAFESTDQHYTMGLILPDLEGNKSFQVSGVVVAIYRPLA
jgi:SOS-response transcriptional repressor LexA